MNLVFDCIGARHEPYAASPTLVLRLRITELDGADVQAIALRCQIRILPIRRGYSGPEEARLGDLFGPRERWPETLRPLQFATVALIVPRFTGATEIDLPVACTYDLEVAASRYFDALEDGEIPLLLLFSGTVFMTGEIAMVPWDRECDFRLPVAVWRTLMDHHFPGAGWLRLTRETMDSLQGYKNRNALPTWDATIASLLKEVRDGV